MSAQGEGHADIFTSASTDPMHRKFSCARCVGAFSLVKRHLARCRRSTNLTPLSLTLAMSKMLTARTRASRLIQLFLAALFILVASNIFQFGFVKETTDIRSAASEGKIFRIEDFPQPPPSVFTNRTGYAQPRWATKYFFLPQPNKTAGDKSLCFVHVGKTAGTTIACYLGFRYRSEQAFVMPQGRLRDNTVHAFHNWVNDCPDDDDYYLFATRDPISRIKSWFTYERPMNNFNWAPGEEGMQQKRLFIDCPFPHLNDLAEKGLKINHCLLCVKNF